MRMKRSAVAVVRFIGLGAAESPAVASAPVTANRREQAPLERWQDRLARSVGPAVELIVVLGTPWLQGRQRLLRIPATAVV